MERLQDWWKELSPREHGRVKFNLLLIAIASVPILATLTGVVRTDAPVIPQERESGEPESRRRGNDVLWTNVLESLGRWDVRRLGS